MDNFAPAFPTGLIETFSAAWSEALPPRSCFPFHFHMCQTCTVGCSLSLATFNFPFNSSMSFRLGNLSPDIGRGTFHTSVIVFTTACCSVRWPFSLWKHKLLKYSGYVLFVSVFPVPRSVPGTVCDFEGCLMDK